MPVNKKDCNDHAAEQILIKVNAFTVKILAEWKHLVPRGVGITDTRN